MDREEFRKLKCCVCKKHTPVMVKVDYIFLNNDGSFSSLYCKDKETGWRMNHGILLNQIREYAEGNITRINMTDMFIMKDKVVELKNAYQSHKIRMLKEAGLW